MVGIKKIFAPLYKTDKRYILVTGGRGSLKSTTVHDFICRLTYQEGQGILFTRYTMKSAEKSIIPEFKQIAERNGSIQNFHFTREKVTNKLTGSFIMFSGIKTSSGDQTASLKSLPNITTWIIEEGEDFTDEKAFDDIDDSIRTNAMQNRVIWIQNPSTKEHFIYQRWIANTQKKRLIQGYSVTVSDHEDVEHIHTTFHIAEEYLSKSFLKKAEDTKKNNFKRYFHKYIGGWLEKAEGVIYEDWIEGEFDESLPSIYGMDFGFSTDPSTLVKVATDNENIYVQELMYHQAMSTDDIALFLEDVVNKNDLIVADNAEPRLISELQAKGFNVIKCTKGADSIRNGIANMNRKTIVVSPNSPNMKIELNNYVWNNKRSNVPKDTYNHLLDATRYAYDELSNDAEIYFK